MALVRSAFASPRTPLTQPHTSVGRTSRSGTLDISTSSRDLASAAAYDQYTPLPEPSPSETERGTARDTETSCSRLDQYTPAGAEPF